MASADDTMTNGAHETPSHLTNGPTTTTTTQNARPSPNSPTSTTTNNNISEVLDYTSIAKLYTDRSVFITGGTGFMGKVLVEKLLRSCPGIKNIYLLIRPKKGQETAARLNDLLNTPVSSTGVPPPPSLSANPPVASFQLFDSVRKERPNDLNKVIPICGDITSPELGISENDQVRTSVSV